MSNLEQWRKLAEENGIDCTLRRVEIKCVLDHVAISGNEFMPYGWCGECETCKEIPCPDICEACSYTDKYDMRQAVAWPCATEKQRLYEIAREAEEERLAAIRQRRWSRGS